MFTVLYKRHVGSQWKTTGQVCNTLIGATEAAEAKLSNGYFRVRVCRLILECNLTPD